MTDKLMNKFGCGNANIPGVYFDEPNRSQLMAIRALMQSLLLISPIKAGKTKPGIFYKRLIK